MPIPRFAPVLLTVAACLGSATAVATSPISNRPLPRQSPSCFMDEPATVTLKGGLAEQTFQDADGKPETYFVLHFDPPICTNGSSAEDSWDEPQSDIADVQLVFLDDPDYLYKSLRPYLGKTVECTGQLFDASTAHHHTPVLIQISKRDCHGV